MGEVTYSCIQSPGTHVEVALFLIQ